MANYLYNSVELPDINAVWTDKETYPYAIIIKSTMLSTTYYELQLYREMFTCYSPAFEKYSLVANGSDELKSRIKSTDTEWATPTVVERNTIIETVEVDGVSKNYTARLCDYPSDYVFWTNHTFYDESGGVWFAASDPVPLVPTLTARDLYKNVNGQLVKHTLYKKLGGVLVKVDEYTK